MSQENVEIVRLFYGVPTPRLDAMFRDTFVDFATAYRLAPLS